jgi:predicted branched-subunit amino acid permease
MTTSVVNRSSRAERIREGVELGASPAIATLVVAVSFGVAARPTLGAAGAIVMSAVIFGGSAQFAAVAVLAAGGGTVTAVAAGVLAHARYGPMGMAMAPWMGGSALRRALLSQSLVDPSWALARRGGGFDPAIMFGASVIAYPAWVLGTAAGVAVGGFIGDSHATGLDAVFPAFFLALLVRGDLARGSRAVAAAAAGGALALITIPLVPTGVPVVIACAAAVIGVTR